jgi:hypothetical protein
LLSPSRVDVYADTQGWVPTLDDFSRFACLGRSRQAYEEPRQLHRRGRHVSGFTFGRGVVLGRIYDKTRQMAQRGDTWQQTVWSGFTLDQPVWRIEFQYRRQVLREFGIATAGQLLAQRQALWDYGLSWLSLRLPKGDTNPSRWPEHPVWVQLRGVQLGAPNSPLIRERIRTAEERHLLAGLVGFLTSWAATKGEHDMDMAMRRVRVRVDAYLRERGLTFGELVERKRALRRALSEVAGTAQAASER